ncbi:MAG: hypothetical protein IH987_03410 [Planctomycetes bacterium]|nr:hypothetical protein [Planctomycetota bacterium]
MPLPVSLYEMLISEKERVFDLLHTRPMAVILDESQRIKNPASKATLPYMSYEPSRSDGIS